MQSSISDFLAALGFEAKLLVAGFIGGVVHTFFFRQTDPYTVVGSIVMGTFSANYFAGPIANYTGFSAGTCGFVAGFGAMVLLAGLINYGKAKLGGRVTDGTKPQ